jgi:cell division protein FtsZ
MTLFELTDAINLIRDSVLEDANIIIGTSVNEDMQSEISITVVATGFELKPQVQTMGSQTGTMPDASPLFQFGGEKTDFNIGGQSTQATPSTGSAAGATPSLPPFSGVSFSNIEIPDFLKK